MGGCVEMFLFYTTTEDKPELRHSTFYPYTLRILNEDKCEFIPDYEEFPSAILNFKDTSDAMRSVQIGSSEIYYRTEMLERSNVKSGRTPRIIKLTERVFGKKLAIPPGVLYEDRYRYL
jgi:hypothetical protein